MCVRARVRACCAHLTPHASIGCVAALHLLFCVVAVGGGKLVGQLVHWSSSMIRCVREAHGKVTCPTDTSVRHSLLHACRDYDAGRKDCQHAGEEGGVIQHLVLC